MLLGVNVLKPVEGALYVGAEVTIWPAKSGTRWGESVENMVGCTGPHLSCLSFDGACALRGAERGTRGDVAAAS